MFVVLQNPACAATKVYVVFHSFVKLVLTIINMYNTINSTVAAFNYVEFSFLLMFEIAQDPARCRMLLQQIVDYYCNTAGCLTIKTYTPQGARARATTGARTGVTTIFLK